MNPPQNILFPMYNIKVFLFLFSGIQIHKKNYILISKLFLIAKYRLILGRGGVVRHTLISEGWDIFLNLFLKHNVFFIVIFIPFSLRSRYLKCLTRNYPFIVIMYCRNSVLEYKWYIYPKSVV